MAWLREYQVSTITRDLDVTQNAQGLFDSDFESSQLEHCTYIYYMKMQRNGVWAVLLYFLKMTGSFYWVESVNQAAHISVLQHDSRGQSSTTVWQVVRSQTGHFLSNLTALLVAIWQHLVPVLK